MKQKDFDYLYDNYGKLPKDQFLKFYKDLTFKQASKLLAKYHDHAIFEADIIIEPDDEKSVKDNIRKFDDEKRLLALKIFDLDEKVQTDILKRIVKNIERTNDRVKRTFLGKELASNMKLPLDFAKEHKGYILFSSLSFRLVKFVSQEQCDFFLNSLKHIFLSDLEKSTCPFIQVNTLSENPKFKFNNLTQEAKDFLKVNRL